MSVLIKRGLLFGACIRPPDPKPPKVTKVETTKHNAGLLPVLDHSAMHEAPRATRALAGIQNFNGGDSISDRDSPSDHVEKPLANNSMKPIQA